MTDRIKGFVITLDRDYRTDDVEAIANALRMVRGVADVSPSVADVDDHMNRARVRSELKLAVWRAIDAAFEEKPNV